MSLELFSITISTDFELSGYQESEVDEIFFPQQAITWLFMQLVIFRDVTGP